MRENVRIRSGQFQFPQGEYYRHFPEGCGADVRQGGRSFNRAVRPRAEVRVVSEEPKRDVGVEQQLHSE